MKLADRMNVLGTESAFEVLAKARALEAEGRSIIHLEIGEPDFDTPEHIRRATIDAMQAGHTHYVPAPGIPLLREACVDFLERFDRMKTSADRIIVTPGAKPIMFLAIGILAGPGDEIVYPDPGFPMYESLTKFFGATPVPYPLREENEFRVDPQELKSLVGPKTKLIILNTPHNPCGSALTKEDCDAIAEIAIANDTTVLTDEVYWALTYGGEHHSVLEIPEMHERTILLDGWSKTFAMTGWRLGFGVFPEELVEPATRLVINTVSCTSAFSQHGAAAALTGPWDEVEMMKKEFDARRQLIVDGLNAIDGISCVDPGGAFYVFPSIKELGVDSKTVMNHIMEKAGVACLWGSAFGAQGEGYLRFSYANSQDNIKAALDAIGSTIGEVRA
ncbi:MAG: pyridoxal phosphate-dependent aminotransferase [Actinomycetota bacterium]